MSREVFATSPGWNALAYSTGARRYLVIYQRPASHIAIFLCDSVISVRDKHETYKVMNVPHSGSGGKGVARGGVKWRG